MIYLDSSAILKLVLPEPESEPLLAYLGDHGDAALLTSQVSTVEVHRALIRLGHPPESEPHRLATSVLDGMEQLALAPIIGVAATLPGEHLRSLDALHLATVAVSPSMTSFVTYDRRLATHAISAGIPVEAPM